MSIAYYNGELQEKKNIRISLSDRAIFFGDGIYDAAIGKGEKIYLEEEHINRFFDNARKLNIPVTFTKTELSKMLKSTILANKFEQYFVYFQLTRTSQERLHAYPDTQKSNILITVKRHELPSPKKQLKLITRADDRYFMCDIKTLNLLPAVLASRAAVEAGCDEAVFVRGSTVTECAHSNVSIIKDGVLYTHPKTNLILPGITRERMLFICKRVGIPYTERPFDRNELFSADEILVSSTTKLLMRASHLDGFSVGCRDNKTSKKLIYAMRKDFFDAIR